MFAFLQTRQSLCLLGSRASFGQTSLAVQPLLASSNWQTHRSYVSRSLAAFAADNGEDDGDLLPPMPPSSFTAPQREEQTISAPIDVDADDDDLPIPQEPVSAPDGQWSYDDLIIAKHSSMHPNVLAVKEIERSSQPSFEELSDSDSDDDVTGADDEASRIRSFDAMTGGVFSKRTIEGLGNRDIRLIHSEDADQIDDEPSLLDQTVSRFDDEGRREFKSRVKIGNLRKPGQIEEEDEPKTAEQIAAENPIVEAADFDSREEEMLKLTANRGHFAFARPELRRKSSSEAMNYEKDEGSDGDDDDDDDDEQLLEELADSDVEPDSQPILYGNTDLLEEQRYREEREAWEIARTSAQKLDGMVFSVDKEAAEEHFRARQESGVDQKRTLAELQYLKIYPKEPRKWVEDLKTPPGWFSEETGHWEGLEHGDDFEYAEYWRSALPMIAAEREAAVKKETPKGMKVIAPSDTAGYYRFGITQQEIDSIPNISQKVLDAISFNEATQREINQFRKERAIDTWGYKPHDTGSTPVQIAVLSEKINYLSDHLTRHPKDKHSAYGFQRIRNRRKALMKYLKKKDTPTYFKLLRQLNIRDV